MGLVGVRIPVNSFAGVQSLARNGQSPLLIPNRVHPGGKLYVAEKGYPSVGHACGAPPIVTAGPHRHSFKMTARTWVGGNQHWVPSQGVMAPSSDFLIKKI